MGTEAASDSGRTARSVTFLTNIPNPHGGYLYRALRESGVAAQTIYKGEPASEGRPWTSQPEPPDRIAPSVWAERAEVAGRRPPGSTVVLCGSWATARDATRRLVTAATKGDTRIVVWGERMSDRSGLRDRLRRLYFSPWGLDAVLAIGSWARPSYRAATRGRLPVHVFPYSTDDGLDVVPRRAPRPLVGFAGRLIEQKGPEVLIRAIGSMPPAERPALDLVGSGPLGDRLRALSSTLGVDATFHGEVDAQRLAALRARWWVAAAPSQAVPGYFDGWGLVVPEALNSSVPVIASAYIGAAHDLIRPGVDGAVVPMADAHEPAVWAEALGAAFAGDRAELAANARQVGEAFSAAPAARWLAGLLAGDLRTERSFVDDTWAELGVAPAP